MYSITSSVSNEGFKSDKCREIVRLTEKISELETCIQTLIKDSKSARALDNALDATSLVNSVVNSVLIWVTVRRCSCGTKHRSSVPITITITNRFSPTQ